MQPLHGRSAIVTGVSRRRGIGFAIADRLAALGADVFAHGWSPFDATQEWGADEEGHEALLEALRARGTTIAGGEIDLRDPAGPAAVLTAATNALGHIDIVIANHAHHSPGFALGELTADVIDPHLGVNVRATMLLVQEIAAHHDGRPGGRVVMLTSGQHLGPMSAELAYAASKGAIHQLTWSLSNALVGDGFTVNTVNPGPTDTGWATDDDDEFVKRHMPGGRWGSPDDAARLIAWLCTDDASWVTGQVIDSEGGFRRG